MFFRASATNEEGIPNCRCTIMVPQFPFRHQHSPPIISPRERFTGHNQTVLMISRWSISMRKAMLFLAAIGLAVLALLLDCRSTPETTWEDLNERAGALYQKGQYSEAAELAEESLKVAEKKFGDNHPNVALLLNNLARLYYAQGKYDDAEPLYRRSLTISEKALGEDHPNVAMSLENLALLLKKTERDAEAERMEARAKAIRAKAR